MLVFWNVAMFSPSLSSNPFKNRTILEIQQPKEVAVEGQNDKRPSAHIPLPGHQVRPLRFPGGALSPHQISCAIFLPGPGRLPCCQAGTLTGKCRWGWRSLLLGGESRMKTLPGSARSLEHKVSDLGLESWKSPGSLRISRVSKCSLVELLTSAQGTGSVSWKSCDPGKQQQRSRTVPGRDQVSPRLGRGVRAWGGDGQLFSKGCFPCRTKSLTTDSRGKVTSLTP